MSLETEIETPTKDAQQEIIRYWICQTPHPCACSGSQDDCTCTPVSGSHTGFCVGCHAPLLPSITTDPKLAEFFPKLAEFYRAERKGSRRRLAKLMGFSGWPMSDWLEQVMKENISCYKIESGFFFDLKYPCFRCKVEYGFFRNGSPEEAVCGNGHPVDRSLMER